MENLFDLQSTLTHEDAQEALDSGTWTFSGSNILLRKFYQLRRGKGKGAFVPYPVIKQAEIRRSVLYLTSEDGHVFSFSLMEWKFDKPDKDTITFSRKVTVQKQKSKKDGGGVVSVEIVGAVAVFKRQNK